MGFETRERLADLCGTIFIYGSEENRAKAQREHKREKLSNSEKDFESREYLADLCGDTFIYGSEEARKKAQRKHK